MLFPKAGKIAILVFAAALLFIAIFAYQRFSYIFDENVNIPNGILIREGATFQEVQDSLMDKKILIDPEAFVWVAKKKNYTGNIKPGYYFFKKDMNTNAMVNMLKSGNQAPVKLTFNNIRFKEEFAAKAARYIKPDSTDILNYLNDTAYINQLGFSPQTISAMFIPNTYEVYWSMSVDDFFTRMKKEYDQFWNEARREKAERIQLSPVEVITLASIVQEETVKAEEYKRVAGVYVNRLKRGIALQADPTIKFALGDFSVRRVLNGHLEIDSPYNTYKYNGLPPGPINFPDIGVIDAVLDYEKHNYYYFCAKEDFSGYHNFARTLREHNNNARKYQRALNKNKIWK